MTNAEKLSKDINLLEDLIFAYCDDRPSCLTCPFKQKNRKCINGVSLKKWLESEAEEDGVNQ